MLPLHPLEHIVNVQWVSYRDMIMAFGVSGPPQFFITFTIPRASYNVGITPLPLPVFGAAKNVPTDTREEGGSVSFPINNRLFATAASIFIDHRAYSYVALREWIGSTSVLTGVTEYYSTQGVKLTAAPSEIPDGHKGKAIFSDDEGTIYAQRGGPGGNGRVYKLGTDTSGEPEELWSIDGGPRTVNVEEGNTDVETTRFIIPGHENNDEINFYNIDDGTLSSSVVLPDGIKDVSREGKVYIRTPSGGGLFSGVAGYTQLGTLLFTIPGESIDDGSQYGDPVAYGEDYILLVATGPQDTDVDFVDHGGGATTTTTTGTLPWWIMVFSANSGAQISKTLWGQEIVATLINAPPPTPPNEIDQSSYAGVQLFRSAYLPARPEEPEETA